MPEFQDLTWAAQHCPVAPYARSVFVPLSRLSEESGRYKMSFQWPIIVAGVHITVITNSAVGGGLLAPRLTDLAVSMTVSEEKSFTSSSRDGSALALGELYADAAAIDIDAPILKGIVLATPGELAFSFRWKRWTGAAIYEDAMVTASACYRRCSEEEARSAIRKLQEWSR